jgi:hypothetical protein
LKIISLKKMSIPKIAVLVTGLAGAILVATISPQAAQALPTFGVTCTTCHAAGGSVTAIPSNATPAAGAAYTVAIALTNTATGNSGFNISLAGVSVTTGGPAAGKTFTANLTAPSAAGTYTYNVGADTGAAPGGAASGTTFTITVGAAPTTTTTTTPVTTTTTPVTTTTTPVATTTTTTPVTTVVNPTAAAVIPAGAPATGAGGSAEPNVSPLAGLGGLALLLAGASATQITRRRRQV